MAILIADRIRRVVVVSQGPLAQGVVLQGIVAQRVIVQRIVVIQGGQIVLGAIVVIVGVRVAGRLPRDLALGFRTALAASASAASRSATTTPFGSALALGIVVRGSFSRSFIGRLHVVQRVKFVVFGSLEVIDARLERRLGRFRAFARLALRRLFTGHAVALRTSAAATAATTLASGSLFLRLVRRAGRLSALGRLGLEDFGQRVFVEEEVWLVGRFRSLPRGRNRARGGRRTGLIANLRLARGPFSVAIAAAISVATTILRLTSWRSTSLRWLITLRRRFALGRSGPRRWLGLARLRRRRLRLRRLGYWRLWGRRLRWRHAQRAGQLSPVCIGLGGRRLFGSRGRRRTRSGRWLCGWLGFRRGRGLGRDFRSQTGCQRVPVVGIAH